MCNRKGEQRLGCKFIREAQKCTFLQFSNVTPQHTDFIFMLTLKGSQRKHLIAEMHLKQQLPALPLLFIPKLMKGEKQLLKRAALQNQTPAAVLKHPLELPTGI